MVALCISILLGYQQKSSCFDDTLKAKDPPLLEDVVIFKNFDRYSAFPDLWHGSDGWIYVSFGARFRRSHHDARSDFHCFRSLDGKSWMSASCPPSLGSIRTKRGTQLKVSVPGWQIFPKDQASTLKRQGWPVHEEPDCVTALIGGVKITRSSDQGKTWQTISHTFKKEIFMAYGPGICLRNNTVLVPLYGRSTTYRKSSSSFVLRSIDDGENWELIKLAEDPGDALPLNETALLELLDGRVIAVIRVDAGERFLHISESTDSGKTWPHYKKTAMWGLPATLVNIAKSDILCAYGYRRHPLGVRASLSTDSGKTWDLRNELVIRADGFGASDIGYPRATKLNDGTILIVYYFTLRDGITHIRATRVKKEHFGKTKLLNNLENNLVLGSTVLLINPTQKHAQEISSYLTDGRIDSASRWESKDARVQLEISLNKPIIANCVELYAGLPEKSLKGLPNAVILEGQGESGWLKLSETTLPAPNREEQYDERWVHRIMFKPTILKGLRIILNAKKSDHTENHIIIREITLRNEGT